MATHSSLLAREMPWTEGPGGLLSTGCKRVRHDLVTKEQQQPSMPIKEKKTKQNDVLWWCFFGIILGTKPSAIGDMLC